MVKSILHTLDKSIAPTTDELLELTDYLFKIENWGYYEITLFGNCVRTINYPTFSSNKRNAKKFYILLYEQNK